MRLWWYHSSEFLTVIRCLTIVLTMASPLSYRTNVFGFPNAPGIPTENLGILDQRLAVEWLRDNIAAFGGNPEQMTLFGQSAGGISVDIHSYAFASDPIVKGLIMQSGAAGVMTAVGGGTDYDSWGKLTAKLGCTGSDLKKISCMRALPFQSIKDAMEALTPPPDLSDPCGGVTQLKFGPREDGKVIFSNEEYLRRGEAGEFAKIVGSHEL